MCHVQAVASALFLAQMTMLAWVQSVCWDKNLSQKIKLEPYVKSHQQLLC